MSIQLFGRSSHQLELKSQQSARSTRLALAESPIVLDAPIMRLVLVDRQSRIFQVLAKELHSKTRYAVG